MNKIIRKEQFSEHVYRFEVEAPLIARARIQKEAVFVGCGRYAEIWAAEEYAAKMEEEDVVAIAASLRKLRQQARGQNV